METPRHYPAVLVLLVDRGAKFLGCSLQMADINHHSETFIEYLLSTRHNFTYCRAFRGYFFIADSGKLQQVQVTSRIPGRCPFASGSSDLGSTGGSVGEGYAPLAVVHGLCLVDTALICTAVQCGPFASWVW